MDMTTAQSGRQVLMLWLGCAALAIVVGLPPDAHAVSCQHGAAIFKSCQSPKRSCASDANCDDSNECTADSCDTVTLDNHTDCVISLTHADTCGDITKITDAWDVQDTIGDNVRVPAAGNLPIVGTFGNAVCCTGPVLPCFVGPALDGSTISGAETGCGDLTLPGAAGAGTVSFQQNTYLIQPDDPDPLEDQANVKVKDLCTSGVAGCSGVPSTVQFTAATDLETGCVNDPEPNSTPCTDTDGDDCSTAGCDGLGSCDQLHIVEPNSTPCPDTDGNECTEAGCNGAGACDQNHVLVANSTPCADIDGNLCTTAGCNGAGLCEQTHIEQPCIGECLTGACDPGTGQCIPEPSSTPCTEADGNECTTAGCDGAGACDQTHILVPDSTTCTDNDGNECTIAGCNGAGTCDQNHNLLLDTLCGDPANTDCTNPDTCDGAGNCLDNHEQNSTPCTEADGNECTTAGCDGAGICEQDHVIVPESSECTDDDGNECTTAGCDVAASCDQEHIIHPGIPCEGDGTCNEFGECVHPPPPDDHYKCYKTRQLGAKFARRSVDLDDQFGSTSTSVVKPRSFCNPVDKNGEGISDPTAHLMCYKIREPRIQRQDMVVENQFGQQTLTVLRPYELCLPAEKDEVPSDLNINHFKCYRVKENRPRFVRRNVDLQDQFETRDTTVKRPRLLCNPVEKNGEGIRDPENHLVCYSIRDAAGQPKFERRQVDVVDQFAEQDLNTLRGDCRKGSLLCVPSTKRLASPSGAFLDVETGLLD